MTPRGPVSGARGPRFAGRNVLVTGVDRPGGVGGAGDRGRGRSRVRGLADREPISRRSPRTCARPAGVANGTRRTSAPRTTSRRRSPPSTRPSAGSTPSTASPGSPPGGSATAPIHEATLAGWETVITANATSQFLVARAAVRRMLAQAPDAGGSRGSILLMSSTLATRPVPAHFATHGYAASKAAIEGLARAMAATYASRRHPRQRDRAVGRRDADEPPGAGRRGGPRLPRGQAAPRRPARSRRTP